MNSRELIFCHLLPRRSTDSRVGGHETHSLTVPVLGGQALEHGVGVRREANLERPVLLVRTDAVEDDNAAGAMHRHEAGQQVDELAAIFDSSRVQDVVAKVEQEVGSGTPPASDLVEQ